MAQVQGRHAHHGRHHVHPGCGRHRVHPGLELHAGGGVLAPLRVSLRPDLRPDRLCGRLPQGPPAPERGTDGPAEVHPSAGGGGGVPGADAVRGPADQRPVYPLPEHELYHQLDRVSDLRGLRHCGLRQRCESDRRHRRAGCQRHLCGDGVLHRSRRPLEHLRHPGSVPGGYGGRAGSLLRL